MKKILPPPLLKADSATLTFYPGKEGKTDANYPNWDGTRTTLAGQMFAVWTGSGDFWPTASALIVDR
jgi:hypothetical protein